MAMLKTNFKNFKQILGAVFKELTNQFQQLFVRFLSLAKKSAVKSNKANMVNKANMANKAQTTRRQLAEYKSVRNTKNKQYQKFKQQFAKLFRAKGDEKFTSMIADASNNQFSVTVSTFGGDKSLYQEFLGNLNKQSGTVLLNGADCNNPNEFVDIDLCEMDHTRDRIEVTINGCFVSNNQTYVETQKRLQLNANNICNVPVNMNFPFYIIAGLSVLLCAMFLLRCRKHCCKPDGHRSVPSELEIRKNYGTMDRRGDEERGVLDLQQKLLI